VEKLVQALNCFTHGFYVNSFDLFLKNWPKAYYGKNFKRLVKVKRKYDPEDIFNFPQSIPLNYECVSETNLRRK